MESALAKACVTKGRGEGGGFGGSLGAARHEGIPAARTSRGAEGAALKYTEVPFSGG